MIIMSVIVLFIVQPSIGGLYKHRMNGLQDIFYYMAPDHFLLRCPLPQYLTGKQRGLAYVMVGSAFIVCCLITVMWHYNDLVGVINRVVQAAVTAVSEQLEEQNTKQESTGPPPPMRQLQSQPTIST